MQLEHSPIYVAISGSAGAGKTTVAKRLVPRLPRAFGSYPEVVFRDYVLASPIYEMVSTKRQIEGDNKADRILYALTDTISELMARRIPYDNFIELVYQVYEMDAGTVDDPKPRTFMQLVGDYCREQYQDCFVDNVIRKAGRDCADEANSYLDEDQDPPHFLAIISDARYANELEAMRATDNFIHIHLDVSRGVAASRILERDGKLMTDEQWNHPTETEMRAYPKDRCDLIIDTDELSAAQVTQQIFKFLMVYHLGEDRYEEILEEIREKKELQDQIKQAMEHAPVPTLRSQMNG